MKQGLERAPDRTPLSFRSSHRTPPGGALRDQGVERVQPHGAVLPALGEARARGACACAFGMTQKKNGVGARRPKRRAQAVPDEEGASKRPSATQTPSDAGPAALTTAPPPPPMSAPPRRRPNARQWPDAGPPPGSA